MPTLRWQRGFPAPVPLFLERWRDNSRMSANRKLSTSPATLNVRSSFFKQRSADESAAVFAPPPAIIGFHLKNPLEGYRRLTFMMLDADIVAVSPTSVWRFRSLSAWISLHFQLNRHSLLEPEVHLELSVRSA
jgi:hypothetical protein